MFILCSTVSFRSYRTVLYKFQDFFDFFEWNNRLKSAWQYVRNKSVDKIPFRIFENISNVNSEHGQTLIVVECLMKCLFQSWMESIHLLQRLGHAFHSSHFYVFSTGNPVCSTTWNFIITIHIQII